MDQSIKTDIPCMILAPNRYIAIDTAIVPKHLQWRRNLRQLYDVTNEEPPRCERVWMGSKSTLNLRIRRSNIIVCTRAKPGMCESLYIKDNQMQLFQQDVAYFIAIYGKNNCLQC